jgi:predicted dienelactone hydrolase
VVFSHGAGGDAPTYDFFGQQWAAAGFVAAFPTHQDSLRAMVSTGQTVTQALAQLQRMVPDPTTWRNRVADIVAAKDAATGGTLGGFAVDRAACAAAGHSLGAWTAMLATGVTPILDGAPLELVDRSFTTALLLSAQGVGQWGLTDSSFAGLTVPTIAMSGTLDRSQTPGASQTYQQKLEPAELSPPGNKWAVVVVDATHFSFSGPGSGRLLGSTPQERADSPAAVYDAIERLTTAFLQTTMAGESGARSQLAPITANASSPGSVTITER